MKFYHSKFENYQMTFLGLLVLAIFAFSLSDPIFFNLTLHSLIFVFVAIALLIRLEAIVFKRPIITLTETELIFNPTIVLKKTIKLDKIVSMKVEGKYLYLNKRLKIIFNKPNGKTSSLTVYLYQIESSEKFVDKL